MARSSPRSSSRRLATSFATRQACGRTGCGCRWTPWRGWSRDRVRGVVRDARERWDYGHPEKLETATAFAVAAGAALAQLELGGLQQRKAAQQAALTRAA